MAPDHDLQEPRLHLAENSRAERVKASRRVLKYARSHADLRFLLNTIGLNQPPREDVK